MTKLQFQEMLSGLAAAWAERNYTRAADFFAPDIKYGDPTRYGFNGRSELLAFFEDDEGYDHKATWHNIVFDPEMQLGTVEYTHEGTHRYHGVVLIRVSQQGITHWRENQHI